MTDSDAVLTPFPDPGPTAGPSPLPPPPPAPVTRAANGPAGTRRAATWITAPLIAVLAVGLFLGGAAADRSGWLGSPATSSPTAAPGGSPADLALVEEAWRTVHEHYVDAQHLDDAALAYGAIRGITAAIGDDGHTSFLTAEQEKAFSQSLSGSSVGIGVQIIVDSNAVVIAAVFPGTPAEEAGLRHGDRIAAVDGKPTDGESLDAVAARVRGPEGEKVIITIDRAGGAPFDVTIVRRKYDIPTSSWSMVPGRTVAVIRLEQFASGATREIKDAITKARAAGATALVLDLRGDPGGYANEAVGVASQFVGDGTVYQSINAGGVEKDVPVEPGGLATDIPLVVLADGGTASSAEIVTGAIQDAKRGQVVGERTFGTGTVTQNFDLSDGSVLRIGVERWLTRAGRPIWHEGLMPDVSVALAADVRPVLPINLRDMTAGQLAASDDVQLLRALELLEGKG